MDFAKTLWIRVTSDKRRFSMLCVLVGIGLLLWARLIIASDMPRTALAEPEAEAKKTSATPSSDNPPRREIDVALDNRTNRDPFVISAVHFPRPNDSTSNDEDRTKSHPEPDEDPVGIEAATRLRLRAAVDRLSLDAVMPTASVVLIDGKRYGLGDPVAAESNGQRCVFIVVEVNDRSVILEQDDRRFELEMSGPGG